MANHEYISMEEYRSIVEQRETYRKWWIEHRELLGKLEAEIVLLKRQIAGLRGYVNRLKRG